MGGGERSLPRGFELILKNENPLGWVRNPRQKTLEKQSWEFCPRYPSFIHIAPGQFCPLPAGRSWAPLFRSLTLNFPICEVGGNNTHFIKDTRTWKVELEKKLV